MDQLSRVLLVGIDAAEGRLIHEWAHAGRLPTFGSLFERAAWGASEPPIGLYVGAVWPSLQTGVSPARHGRHCYCQIERGSYATPRFRPQQLKREPFWNALSRAGRRVAILDVPKTFPSENLNGVQLCDWGTHDPEGPACSWPPEFASTVEARFGPDPLGKCDAVDRQLDGFTRLRDALVLRAARRAKLTAHVLAEDEWDFLATVFSESHCVGHQCWHIHDSEHPDHDAQLRRRLGDPIEDVYAAIDAALGRLLEQVDERTTVLVVASHGMGPHYDATFLLGEILRRIEDAPLSAARRWTGRAISRIWDRIPSELRTALAPSRRRIGQRLGAALPTLEMQGSRNCFAVPNNSVYGGIRLNLVGREPNGRLHRGTEAELFCEELSRDLLALVEPGTGRPLVRRVLKTAELYEGECLEDLPDLLVEWNREQPINAVASPKIGLIEGKDPATRTGDHQSQGLFFAMGPGIQPGRIDEPVSVMDFAPTVAGLLGVDLDQVDGRSIAPLLAAGRR
jgi:predicted AlkP superfamily phosphohydrolase/phosphomutase